MKKVVNNLFVFMIIFFLVAILSFFGFFIVEKIHEEHKAKNDVYTFNLKLNAKLELYFDQINKVFNKLEKLDLENEVCNKNIVDKLKIIQFDNYIIQHASIILNDGYICSSLLSLFKDPLSDVKPDLVVNGMTLWFNQSIDGVEYNDKHVVIEKNGFRVNVHLKMLFDFKKNDPNRSYLSAQLLANNVSVSEYGLADSSNLLSKNEYLNSWIYVVKKSNIPGLHVFTGIPKDKVELIIFNSFEKSFHAIILMSFIFSIVIFSVFYIWKNNFKNTLFEAMENEEISPFFQPIIDAKESRCVGAEILCRWRSKSRNIAPSLFIPRAESYGLINHITRYVISSSLEFIGDYLRMNSNFYISFNISASEVYDDVFFEWLCLELESKSVLCSQIRIELTERELANKEELFEKLSNYRMKGFKIYIDDFGTGYSSLSYLKDLPIDVLKIDKSFIEYIGLSSETGLIVEHIIGMAKSLNFDLVAEGVETDEQMKYLTEKGVVIMQGWLFSKALSTEDFLKYIAIINSN
ncbi:EAL domain-containing protein [Vibrio parahaemolyticus O1:K58]|nr:EAL domain-containing protein [Vibrio parahaemolyticus O1:K58]EKO7418344.1 EAL domain-containing protein [Vibrio parahaemolyticus]EMA9068840.1 EAL domain-containing protein [Vibrio parahaemolyticus]